MSALVSGIGARVFLSISSIRGLGARGRQEHCRGSGQPKIRAGQFHSTKIPFRRQTNNLTASESTATNLTRRSGSTSGYLFIKEFLNPFTNDNTRGLSCIQLRYLLLV